MEGSLAMEAQRIIDPRNTLNDLTGAEWLYATKSLLVTSYKPEFGHQLRKEHGANKPPRLMKQLIETFTKPGAAILDPMAGVGGTLIGSSICGTAREAVGIEINPRWIEIYLQVLEQESLRPQTMQEGDCLTMLPRLAPGSFDGIFMDPPYTVHLPQTMSGGERAKTHANRRSDYNMRSDAPDDLANLATYADYLNKMEVIFTECFRVLKPGKYLIFIVRDQYQQGEYIFTHVDLARRAQNQGFQPKGEILWYQAGTRLRPYGYPRAFIPNIAHQYIVILRKEQTPKQHTRREERQKKERSVQ
jgi:DNA modification methylase